VTFYRMLQVPIAKLVTACMPITGSIFFLIGSPCYMPGGSETMKNVGGALFLVASVAFTIAPCLDAWEIFYEQNLADAPPSFRGCEKCKECQPGGCAKRQVDDVVSHNTVDFEELYKGHLVKMQGANAVIYACGGVLFIIGSLLFFPFAQGLEVHANWLYISGCFVVVVGAALGVATALELKKTAAVVVYNQRCLSWSDEDATIFSCSVYIVGNVIFIISSVLFLPSVLATTKTSMCWSAVGGFMVGSVCFLLGSLIDLLVLLREAYALHSGSHQDGAIADKKSLLEDKPLIAKRRGGSGCCRW